MIKFIVNGFEKIKKVPPDYPKCLYCEVDFKIIINDRVFFEEPNFPIYEFINAINCWIDEKEDSSFEYVSMETEDNPLISFIYDNKEWRIVSPWQLFESADWFTKEEIVSAFESACSA